MTRGDKPVHSNAEALGDGRLSAPAATRNVGPIVAALAPQVPASGLVLEIAAGTGQHAVACARAFPGLTWQPTDIAPARLASIDAWAAAEGLANIRAAAFLDAATPEWSWQPVELVVLINLMHLISRSAARNVIRGIARVLVPGGRAFLYGPFRTGGAFRSEGDAAFHARLSAADPGAGYKDLEWIEAEAAEAGLARRALVEMPANNLALILEKR
jgi:SAM-dependent methyltransferase